MRVKIGLYFAVVFGVAHLLSGVLASDVGCRADSSKCVTTLPPGANFAASEAPTPSPTTALPTSPPSAPPSFHPITKSPFDPNLRPLGYAKVIAVVGTLALLGLSIALFSWWLRVRRSRQDVRENAMPLIGTE